jgi:hypothetical protein
MCLTVEKFICKETKMEAKTNRKLQDFVLETIHFSELKSVVY